MLKSEYITALKQCLLFEGVEPLKAFSEIEDRCRVQNYASNETVYTRSRFNDSMGIVLAGYIEVYKDETKNVMLNRIGSGGFFGAAALFADKKEYVSVLVAKGNCSIMFIPFEEFKVLLSTNSSIALNYIRFLSSRIEFLNKKIDEFTAPDTFEKLSRYLLDKAVCEDGKTVCKVKSMVELSKRLNMGRASLYRSFEELERQNIISRDGKNIIIDDIDKLKEKRKSK